MHVSPMSHERPHAPQLLAPATTIIRGFVHELDLPDDLASYTRWVRELTNLSVGKTEEIIWPAP